MSIVTRSSDKIDEMESCCGVNSSSSAVSLSVRLPVYVFIFAVDLNIKRNHYVYRHVTAAENTVSIRSPCGRCVGLDSGLFPLHVCHNAKEVTCTVNFTQTK